MYVGNDKYTVVARNNQLQLTVAKGDGYTGGDLTGSVAVSDMIVTGKITGASVDISGTSAVQSGISSPNSTALTLNIADNSDATIEGGIVGKGSDTISVGDNAQVTITGGIQTTGGNDSIVIGTNSNVEITGEVKATNGDDSIVIGDGSTVEIKGTDRIYLGNGQNSTVVGKNASLIVGGLLEGSGTLEIGKGGTVQTKGCESIIFVTMDVDSVLNNTSAIQSGIKVDVVGVSDLVLNDAADADIAGVKAVYHGCSSIQDNAKLKVDGVDMVLGSAKQIQGADTTETTDDVWASLNRVGNDLVVAWGRSEAEVGVALTAFGDGTSLVLGESFTATATTLSDSNPDNDFQKKSQGTLA